MDLEETHLRTHTTTITIKYLKEHDVKGVFGIGRVFRNEREIETHPRDFAQIDIAKKGCIEDFL